MLNSNGNKLSTKPNQENIISFPKLKWSHELQKEKRQEQESPLKTWWLENRQLK